MATVTAPQPIDVAPLLPPSPDGHARFSRTAYHRLVEVGVLDGDHRLELIDGEIFTMSPIGPTQGSLISRLNYYFTRHLPETYDCRVQLPIGIGEHSEPEPDIALVRRRADDYQVQHPGPDDIVLLIEVAQSSLAFDLGRKLQLYAGAGISEYWVVDAVRNVVLVHRNPSSTQYQSLDEVARGGVIAPASIPECRLDLGWLFR